MSPLERDARCVTDSIRRTNDARVDYPVTRTGTTEGHLMQDINKGLFKALERDPNARQLVREAAAAITTWKRLPFRTPLDMWQAFVGGAKFRLHYHGKSYDVETMRTHWYDVYVTPPGMPVSVYPDGRSKDGGHNNAIWLELLETDTTGAAA